MLSPSRRLAGVCALAILLLLALPGTAAADAELETAIPADGSTVEGTPDEIVLLFTQPVFEGSSLELRSAADEVLATGGPDPAGTIRMAIVPPTLESGTYTVRWTSIASDGHVVRGTVTFVVTAPPTPSPTPEPTPAPSASASPAASPTSTPDATPSHTPAPSAAPTDPTAGSGDVLIPIIAALVVLGALGVYLLRRRSGAA